MYGGSAAYWQHRGKLEAPLSQQRAPMTSRSRFCFFGGAPWRQHCRRARGTAHVPTTHALRNLEIECSAPPGQPPSDGIRHNHDYKTRSVGSHRVSIFVSLYTATGQTVWVKAVKGSYRAQTGIDTLHTRELCISSSPFEISGS